MATIGKNTAGANLKTWAGAWGSLMHRHASLTYTAGANEQIEEIHLYAASSDTGNRAVQIGIYDVTAGVGVGQPVLLTAQNVTITADTGTPAWVSVTGLSVALTEGNDYVCAVSSSADGVIELYHDSLSTSSLSIESSTTPGTLPSTSDQATSRNEDYSLYAVTGAATAAPVISGVSGNNAEGTVTITVDSYDTVSSVTYGGTALTNVTEATATTITATMPKGGFAFGSSNDFVVTDANGSSAGYAATFNAPSGMSYVTMTAAYAGLPANSVFYGVTALSGLAIGDQVAYENPVEGGYSVSMDGEGVVTITGAPDGTYNLDYYILDATDTYAAGSSDVITITVGSISSTTGKIVNGIVLTGTPPRYWMGRGNVIKKVRS